MQDKEQRYFREVQFIIPRSMSFSTSTNVFLRDWLQSWAKQIDEDGLKPANDR